MSERKTPQELAAEVWAAIEADENAALAPNAVAMMHVAAALSASEARAADLDRKLTTAMRAGVAMSEAHEAALARVAASEARATAAEEHSRGLESALQIMGEENAKIERERDEARRALREWTAAHDAERHAAQAAARARHKAFAGQPPLPKRIPRNALRMEDLPEEEQRRINDECARLMAPINEAERLHVAARERLQRAVDAARALSGAGAEEGR
jgi:hypothetical protein